jgi:hypothetical protein
MSDKVNLHQKLELLDRPYAPGIVGYLNDYKLVVVKIKGEFVWTPTRTPTTSSLCSTGG